MKTQIIMKSTKHCLMLLMVALIALPCKSFSKETILNTKITISFKDETLKNAIKRIEKETGITFAYANLKDLDKKVNGDFINQPLEAVLIGLLRKTNLSFKEIGGKITLFETSEPEKKTQKATIHGYIYDKQSSERLINAAVYQPDDFKGTTSNNFGFYSITLPAGHVELAASYMGYEPQLLAFSLKADTTINIEMLPTSDQLDEVTVYGNHVNKVDDTQMSMVEIPLQKMKKVPVIFGEADVLKVIQLLPGVQAGVEGTSGIYVRGGGPDQNLFLLDGVPVYNPSHLLGIFSVFNPEALKSVKLYKGAFPARYGGRLSSVVDISMKDGNMKELKGDFSIGLITSKFTLEGPIKTDKTSFMLSARRTYLDLLAKPALMIINKASQTDTDLEVHFHDFNLKVNHIFNERSRLFLSGYHGKDHAKVKDKSYDIMSSTEGHKKATMQWIDAYSIDWGNSIASLRWNYMLSPKLFSNTTATFSHYFFDTGIQDATTYLKLNKTFENEFKYHSAIRDLSAKIDFDYFPTPKHSVKFGVQVTNHLFTPGITKVMNQETDNIAAKIDTTYGNRKMYNSELAAFIEDDFIISTKLKLNAGLNLSAFFTDNEAFIYPQPRLSIRFKASENWSLKTSYSRMVQYVHLLYSSGINLPTDIWVPATKKYVPPLSDQFAIGASVNLKKGLTLTVEGYYKYMHNLIEYKEGASFMDGGANWEEKVEMGNGWAYGAEFLLEKTLGNTTGWLGYTWSKSERQFPNINFGKVFPSKYDRRHDISIVFTHKFSDRFDIGGSWVYSTGNTTTLAYSHYPVSTIDYENIELKQNKISHLGNRNNYRLPAQHRLDVGANFHKEKKKGLRTWSISVYNAYNQMNPFMLYWKNDENNNYTTSNPSIYTQTYKKKLAKVSLLPIIPTVTYSYKF
jgi:hypothetical protein